MGLQILASPTFKIIAFFDANWAKYTDDRHSTSSYYVFSGNNLVLWSSKKQPIVACSSTKVELKVVANATVERIWLQHLYQNLNITLIHAPLLYCDNMVATYLSFNPVLHACMNHVEIDFHFVCNRVLNKSLQVAFISCKDQLADALTKPLSAARVNVVCPNLCLHSLSLALRGVVREHVVLT